MAVLKGSVDKTENELLIRIHQDIIHIKEDLNEIKTEVKKVPVLEERLNAHLENHKRQNAFLIALMSALATIISAIISFFTGK